MRRVLVVLCLVLALVAGSPLPLARAASDAAYDQTLVNRERTSRGLRALADDPGLDACAASHSRQMAAAGRIWHDLSQTAYRCAGSWVAYGENVGMGSTVLLVHDAFMNSPEHRRNVLYPAFTRIGTGVTWSRSVAYVTEIYVERAASARPRPVPRPSPTRAPAVAPRPSRCG